MKQHASGPRAIVAPLFLAFILTLSLLVFGCSNNTNAASDGNTNAASVNDAFNFDGVWAGQTVAGQTTAAVTLTLQPKGMTLRYGSPRNCELALEAPVIIDGRNRQYGIKAGTGGFCSKMEFGKLSVRQGDDGDTIIYEARDAAGALQDKGSLRRSGK